MAYNYEFSKPACDDLDGIIDYISVKLSNHAAAQSFFNNLKESIANICEFPDSGTKLDNALLDDETIRKVFIDNYILYYSFVDNKIFILRIIYAKRNVFEMMNEIKNV